MEVFDSSLYYNKTETSVLENTLVQIIPNNTTFKIAQFGNWLYYHEMWNNYYDVYNYGTQLGEPLCINVRGLGDVVINAGAEFKSDKVLLKQNTTITSNLEVISSFTNSSILNITGSDARYVLQSAGLDALIAGNTNTINSIITVNNSQDVSISQKVDKLTAVAQAIASDLTLNGNITLGGDINVPLTGTDIIRASGDGNPTIRIMDSQGVWEFRNRNFNCMDAGNPVNGSEMVLQNTSDARVRIGTTSNARVGIGRAPVIGYFLSVGGVSQFIDTVMTGNITRSGTNKILNINNGSYINFNSSAWIRKYTLVATSSLYLMDNNQITLHRGSDPSIASNAYMMIDGNNTKIFVYKNMECQGTLQTNTIDDYSGGTVNVNAHLNINTANNIKIGSRIISYYENPLVVQNLEITNTSKDYGIISFDCGLEGTDTDINVATMSWDNFSVFKPSYFYDPITITGGALTCENVIIGATNKLSIDNVEIQKNAAWNTMDIVHTSTAGGFRLVAGDVATNADRILTASKTAVNVYSETFFENTLNSKDILVNTANGLYTDYIRNRTTPELKLEAISGSVINSYINGVKYLALNATNFVSYNGFTLPSDERLKTNIEDVIENAINIVKHIKVKTFIKKGNTKTEIGYIAQQLQTTAPDKYDVVNTNGEYFFLNVSYEK